MILLVSHRNVRIASSSSGRSWYHILVRERLSWLKLRFSSFPSDKCRKSTWTWSHAFPLTFTNYLMVRLYIIWAI